MAKMNRGALWLAAIVLFLPSASAVPFSGTLFAEAIHLPAKSTVQGIPLAFLVSNASSQIAHVEARMIHAIVFEQTRFEVGTIRHKPAETPLTYSRTEYTFSNARLAASGSDADAIFGGYPGQGAALSFNAEREWTLTPSASSIIAEPAASENADALNRGRSWYYAEVDKPHLLSDSAGTFNLTASWALKLRGSTISIDAQEGHFEFDTRTVQVSPVEKRIRWILIESDNLTAELDTRHAHATVAFSAVACAWEGRAFLAQASGEVNGHPLGPPPGNGTLDLEGSFASAIVPRRVESEMLAEASIVGQIEPTAASAAALRIDAPGDLPSWAPFVGALGVSVVVATGAAVAWSHRRKRASKPGVVLVEEPEPSFAELATEAADGGDWALASEFFTRARAEKPQDGELHGEHGMTLLALGDLTRAMNAFDQASDHLDDGEAERWAAICAVRLGQFDCAALFLVRAINRNGGRELLDEIESLHEFESVLRDPVVRAEMEDARLRCCAEGET